MDDTDLLIGRDSDLSNLRHLLDSHRLVTITGPGGVGKTTLARAAVEGRSAVMFGRLAPLPEQDLDDALAGSLGFGSYAALSDALAERTSLLVLDNCEHVIEAATAIASDLLHHHPGLSVLATSREPLAVETERVFPLHPLSTLGDPSPAASLFVRRMLDRGLAAPDDLNDVNALCERLDGLPLAIELAASRTSAMTAADIAEHLESRLDLLSRRRSSGPERHRSITAAVGWSYQLLTPNQQELFLAVSVFDGSFTARMANAITRNDDVVGTAERLAELVEQSLVVHEPGHGRSWYRLLSTIRAYGVERLVNEDRWTDLNERLVNQAAEAAARLGAAALRQDDPSTGPEVGQLFRVFRSAIDWCVDHDAEPDRAMTLAFPLWALEDTGFQAEAADAIETVIARWSIDDARAWGALGMMSRSAGQFPRAELAAQRCVDIGGDGEYLGWRILGLTARANGEYDLARERLSHGASVARRHGHDGLAYELEAHAALAIARSGDIEAAVAEFDRIEVAAEAYPMVSTMCPLMAGLMLIGSDLDRSIAVSTRALEKAIDVDYAWAENHAREQLALAQYLSGERAEAMVGMANAVEYAASRGSRSETWLGLRFAARMFAAHGRADLAAASDASARRVFGDPAIGPAESHALEEIWDGEIESTPADTTSIPELCAELRALASGIDASAVQHDPDDRLFVRRGDVWDVAFGRERALLAATKGMADLAELLARPRTEVAALDLMGAVVVSGSAGEVSDVSARRSYEARIRELQADIEEASQNNDLARAETAEMELDTLIEHLATSYGLSGDKRTVGDVAEKARSAVTWRIRSAIKKIGSEMPMLGDHLDRSVHTGRFCRYDPETDVKWAVQS